MQYRIAKSIDRSYLRSSPVEQFFDILRNPVAIMDATI